MSIGKELFMAAHERLVEEYMAEHPDADESAVYDRMADRAYDRMRDDLAEAADSERKRRREDAMIEQLEKARNEGNNV